MPRYDITRIDQRPPVDSSQSANVPLQVRASIDSAGRGGIGWSVAHALNRVAGEMVDTQSRTADRQRARDEQAQLEKDKKDGQAAAAEAAVTGVQKTANELEAHGKVYTQAYQESDGVRHRYQFEQSIKPELARLEPGSDINDFIQSKAQDYVQNNEMPEESRKSFMMAVAKAQPEWKIEYSKHEINESLKRDEENHGAILSGEMVRQKTLTPEMISAVRDSMDTAGIHGELQDDIIVKAIVPALRSGEINIESAMKTIDGKFGAKGRVLHDVYREQIDNAAKEGRDTQEKAQKKSQEDALTHVSYMLNDKADGGRLGDKEIDLYRRQYSMSPEWAVSLHNRNREAQQKAAKEGEKEADFRRNLNIGLNGDAIHVEGAGYNDVVTAVEKGLQTTIADGIQRNDFAQVPRYLVAAARNNMKLEGFGRIIKGLADSDNPDRFTKAHELYKLAQNVAPGYVDANLDDKTLATMKSYDRRIEVYRDTPQQALQASRAKPDASPEQLQRAMSDFDKKNKPNKPIIDKFDDSQWLSWSPHGATKVANWDYVNREIRGYVADAHKNGQFLDDPSGALEYAQAKFKAENVQVGNRFEKTYGTVASPEQGEKVGAAMTELGKAWHEKLVKDKAIDPEDSVGFAPLPNAPNKWALFNTVGNVRRLAVHEVEVTDPKTGEKRIETQPVYATATDVTRAYGDWRKQEDSRASVTKQGLEQYGLNGLLNSKDPKDLTANLDKWIDQNMTPEDANDLRLKPAQVEHVKKLTAAREFVNDPQRVPQSFSDFIKLTK